MPSPVGHILGGVAVYIAGTKRKSGSRLLLGVSLFGSVVPDFDFIPGIMIGQMGAFHHGISHSLTFAILFGALVFVFARRLEPAAATRASMLGASAYAVHVMLDFVGVSEGTRGVPLFWPLTDEKFGYGLSLFGHFRWGDIREGLGTIIRWDNVGPVLREIGVVGSVVLLLLWWRDRRIYQVRSDRSPNRPLGTQSKKSGLQRPTD